MRFVTRLTLLVLPLAACGDATSTGSTPAVVVGPAATPAALVTDVARGFLEAVRLGDDYARDECLTRPARLAFDGDGALELSEGDLESFELGAAELRGERAEVPVTARVKGSDERMTLLLRQEDEAWRVMGMRVFFDGTTSLTMDFERPGGAFEEIGEALAEGLGAAFEEAFSGLADYRPGASAEEIDFERRRFVEVAAITPERHAAAWQFHLRGGGRPAHEVLEEILQDSVLILDRSTHASALATPITLELERVSRLQAFEAVSAACGLHPTYPDPDLGAAATMMGSAYEPPTITFTRGPRPLPVAFVGPFLLEIEALLEEPPHGTGQLALAVRALGLDPAVTSFQVENDQTVAIGDVLDARGNNLNAEAGVSYFGAPHVDDGYLVDRQQVPLKGLLSSVERIDRLEGTLRLLLPEAVEEVTLEASRKAPLEQGPYVIRRTAWGESIELDIVTGDVDDVRVLALPYDAAGAVMGTNFAYGSDLGTHLVHNVQAHGVADHLLLKLCQQRVEELPFRFEGVPLARAAEQPRAFEPLRLEGDQPLELTFRGFESRGDLSEIQVGIVNRANKEILSASVDFVYRDAQGGEVGSFPHTLTGEFSFQGAAPLVATGKQSSRTLTAFFLPEEAVRVDFVVDEVTFRDASRWTREER